jgi:hypothetical protein
MVYVNDSRISLEDSITEYDEWDHIVRIAMLGLFQDVMRNWRSSATATLGTRDGTGNGKRPARPGPVRYRSD